jgi:ornithine cyclodeaminase
VFETVEMAYRLQPPERPSIRTAIFFDTRTGPTPRIIALPAHIGPIHKSGSSDLEFPDNNASNLARASAVLILNDGATGYPVACIEAS